MDDTALMTCTLYLVRHAEKQQTPGDKDPPLTDAGRRRAEALATRLASEPVSALYASGYRRTQLTLQPLATALALPITRYEASASGVFLQALLSRPCSGAMVIAGHSNTLPELLRAAGIAEPASEFDERRYGELFIVERIQTDSGWQATLRIERFGDSP